jgi:hypothetical protein
LLMLAYTLLVAHSQNSHSIVHIMKRARVASARCTLLLARAYIKLNKFVRASLTHSLFAQLPTSAHHIAAVDRSRWL